MNNPNPLVINWHVNEACNYACKYCYAAWESPKSKRELIRNPEQTAGLLQELYSFFRPDNSRNPLADQMTWQSVRLNLAGGEPLLHARKLPAIFDQTLKLGLEVSMISNGSYLDDELMSYLAPQLSWLGISIDSARPALNRAIGRIDSRGRLLDMERLASLLNLARRSNPNLHIKLNTVVTRLNHGEDLSDLIRSFSPEKWKVLRMLPVVNQELTVTDEQFAGFVDRHTAFDRILCPEDNHEMRDSYIMIDPHGRFFQNSQSVPGEGYVYSPPILDVGAAAAFSSMTFDHQRFSARYKPISIPVVS